MQLIFCKCFLELAGVVCLTPFDDFEKMAPFMLNNPYASLCMLLFTLSQLGISIRFNLWEPLPPTYDVVMFVKHFLTLS